MQTSSASPCARHVVRCCHAAGFEPSVSFESDDYQTVQGLVAAGVGVALIPELALSVVREDIVDPRPLARAARAPGDRGRAEGARLVPAAPAMLAVLGSAAAASASGTGACKQDGAPGRLGRAPRMSAACCTQRALPGLARSQASFISLASCL